MPTLTDATPTLHRQVGKDEWMFQYGDGLVGQHCGAAYINNHNPRYTRFKIVEKDGKPFFQQESERPLTNEELRHFRKLVKELQTPLIDREYGRFI